MVRKKRISDDQVLAAAEIAMQQQGPVRFTLSHAAKQAGIAPATIVQRFGDKRGLVLKVLQRGNDLFAQSLTMREYVPGFEAVVELLVSWVEPFGEGAHFAEQLQWLAEDNRDPEMRRLALLRFEMMRTAIELRLPEIEMDRMIAARMIEATWHGILIQWSVEPTPGLALSMAEGMRPLMHLLKLQARQE